MARNVIFQPGEQLSLPVPEDTASGDPVVIGILVGLALTDRGAGGNADTHATVLMAPSAVVEVSVTGAISNVGQAVYITSAGALTATQGTNTLYGAALETKGTGDGVIRVKLATGPQGPAGA